MPHRLESETKDRHKKTLQQVSIKTYLRRMSRMSEANAHNVNQGIKRVALGVIAVRVKAANNRVVITRAIIDEGSDTSLTTTAFTRK